MVGQVSDSLFPIRSQPARGAQRPRPTNGQSSTGSQTAPDSIAHRRERTDAREGALLPSQPVRRSRHRILCAAVVVASAHTARAGIHNQDGVIAATPTSTVTAAIPFTPSTTPTPSITPTPPSPDPDEHGDRNAADTDTNDACRGQMSGPATGQESLRLPCSPSIPPRPARSTLRRRAAPGTAVFKSTDAGASWRVASALPQSPLHTGVVALASIPHARHALRRDARRRLQEHGRRPELDAPPTRACRARFRRSCSPSIRSRPARSTPGRAATASSGARTAPRAGRR